MAEARTLPFAKADSGAGNVQGVAGFAHGHARGCEAVIAGQHAVGIRDGSLIEITPASYFRVISGAPVWLVEEKLGMVKWACISLTICA